MADAHANFAYSTVATAPSPASSGTSLVVAAADGSKFPAVPFNATVWPVSTQPTTANAEIVRVTAISTDTLTITRTQEGSSARTIVVGDQIAATVTAKTLTDVEAALGQTRRVPVRLDTPDSSGNGYPAISTNNGFSNVRRIVPAFTKDVDGTWEGAVEIPQDYASGGAIIISLVANATSGVFRSLVSTAVVADGVTEDTAYTAETAVDTTVPATALLRKDVSTTLTTTPAKGSTLNVKISHAGTHANDTLAVDCLLWGCHFSYVSV